MRIILKTSLPLLIATIFVFLPFFANSNLLLERNNDLTEFFWPLFYYIKQNILINHQIPIINNMWFAGTNLIGDPQNPIWYLPNIIFLFTNIDTAIIISLFLHTLFGSIGVYLASKNIFNFKNTTSLLLAILYTFSPIYFSYLEAGHWGLTISWDWFPYLLLSSYLLAKKPGWKYIVLFAVSASSIFFNHELTFLIILPFILGFWLYQKSFCYPLFAIISTFVIISPALYFQLQWIPVTTRQILLTYPETFPIWRGKKEFIKSIFLFNPETEKAITFGFIPSILAFLGFVKLKTKHKLFLSSSVLLLTLVVLNNVSPLLPILLKVNLFVVMRVTTRIWPLIFFSGLLLTGIAIEKLKGIIAPVLAIIAIIESLIVGYSYIAKPISLRENIPEGIYNILASDKSNFRVLCLTRCIPQKEAAIRNLKLVEGYGTLQSLDYYYGMQKALNTTWNKYSLSIPPFDVYLYQEIQPSADILAKKFDVKYIISKNRLGDKYFKLLGKFDLYYFYEDSK